MKIAHEAPLSLMQYVKYVTDYDYALASLFHIVEGYYEYFKNVKKEGRVILLDNGVFEEGVSMLADRYAYWIEELQPDEYIVPDVMNDGTATICSFQKWEESFRHLPGRKIGVVHGGSIQEFIECYRFMSAHADKIAINFSQLFYQDVFPTVIRTPDVKRAEGRAFIIAHLYSLGILNTAKPHHLLGASVPSEFEIYGYYKGGLLECIETIDTSNPVVYAIVNGKYPSNIRTVTTKETTKIKDLITTPYSDKLLVNVIHNIAQFKIQNSSIYAG
ncbi:MAG: hypothetical protein WC346_05445 [Methanogenium sp.]|jgi:hypothetical protein